VKKEEIDWEQLHCPVCEHELNHKDVSVLSVTPIVKINPYECPNCGRKWNIQTL